MSSNLLYNKSIIQQVFLTKIIVIYKKILLCQTIKNLQLNYNIFLSKLSIVNFISNNYYLLLYKIYDNYP